ncbi:hypothetical protein Axi01nite_53010 [Actinoplanes xinjiangensis]|nr:hypothetical protein Axi01nite_53010 [Actinoplanes xinjiangensis]
MRPSSLADHWGPGAVQRYRNRGILCAAVPESGGFLSDVVQRCWSRVDLPAGGGAAVLKLGGFYAGGGAAVLEPGGSGRWGGGTGAGGFSVVVAAACVLLAVDPGLTPSRNDALTPEALQRRPGMGSAARTQIFGLPR